MRQCGITRVWTSPEFLKSARVAVECEQIDVPRLIGQWRALDFLRAALLGLLGRVPRGGETEMAAVVFSSGSTGEPKGVQLSHANIRSNVEGISQLMGPTPDHRLLGVLPLFHSFGFTATIWYPLLTGVGVCYHPSPLDAKGIGETVARNRVTHLITTPTFLAQYTRRCTAEQFASLEFVLVGAEKLSARVADEFERKFGLRPLEGYGCTELSPIAAVSVRHQETPSGLQLGHKPGSIGRPIPGVAARIVHPETFEPLGPGADGLLLIKGANVMVGYLGRPELTAEVIRDGWYVTGDIARMDEDGFLTITDRLSRFSKIGGEMVPHVRIEERIHELLGAAETVCAVASAPDETKGERLVVLYVGALDVGALHRKLGESGLPNLWVPKQDAFFRVDGLPVLGSGKLDLKAVQSTARELAARAVRLG
jgi:acyl-[acyl-carrier-protein]-phospholipid O-acyltransferase/long-chain-fatty-acid--[acyl-carrier-protein] ligase